MKQALLRAPERRRYALRVRRLTPESQSVNSAVALRFVSWSADQFAVSFLNFDLAILKIFFIGGDYGK